MSQRKGVLQPYILCTTSIISNEPRFKNTQGVIWVLDTERGAILDIHEPKAISTDKLRRTQRMSNFSKKKSVGQFYWPDLQVDKQAGGRADGQTDRQKYIPE
jgi:hypothetical protein